MEQASPHVSFIILGETSNGDPPPVALSASAFVEHAAGAFEWIRCEGEDAAARRDALSRARGTFVAFIDASDRLHPDLWTYVEGATAGPDVDVIYTDQDTFDDNGYRDPFLKPAFSPERLLAQNYLGRLTIYRTALAVEAAAYCTGNGDIFEHELALRVTHAARLVLHLGRILYHRAAEATPSQGDVSAADDVEPLNTALEEQRVNLRVKPGTLPGIRQVVSHLSDHPLVSIVIPTRGASRRVRGQPIVLVENCISSVVQSSTYDNFEIVVVADTNTPTSTMRFLEARQEVPTRVVKFDRPFNFSEKINTGALNADGDYFLLLNDDIEITDPAWIETLLGFATTPGVGAVGPRLCFEDGRLQHVGVVMADGGAGHPFYGYPRFTNGYFGTPNVVANYLAVTAACLMSRRECFERVGGFSMIFPINYNDVDYCLKLYRAGYRIVYTPEVTLAHYESSSRGMAPVLKEELDLLHRRWGDHIHGDPYYSRQFLPGGNFLTNVRADGRPLDEPAGGYGAGLARRIRDVARRVSSRN